MISFRPAAVIAFATYVVTAENTLSPIVVD